MEMADSKRQALQEPEMVSRRRERRKRERPSILNFCSVAKLRRRRRRVSGSPLFSAACFPLMLLYHEVLLRLFDGDSHFFAMGLIRILLFSLAAGLAVFLLLDLIGNRKVARIVGGVLVGGWTVFTCVEYCCKSFFKIYFGLGYMQGMAGQVVGDFSGTIVEVVLARIPFILLSLIPVVVYLRMCAVILYDKGQRAPVRVMLAVLMVVLQLVGVLTARLGAAKNYYTYDYSVNTAVPHFGLFTALRLELSYAITGIPRLRWMPCSPTTPCPPSPWTPALTRRPATPPPSLRGTTCWTLTSRPWQMARRTKRSRPCTSSSGPRVPPIKMSTPGILREKTSF